MNDRERAVAKSGLREVAARLDELDERDSERGNVRLVVNGWEYVLLARSLHAVDASIDTAGNVQDEDPDLPESLHGERDSVKLVYLIVFRVRTSASGPTAVLKAANILAKIPEVLGEERGESTVHQATRRLKKLGWIRKVKRLGWMLVKEPGTETAPEPPPQNCNPDNAVSEDGNAA